MKRTTLGLISLFLLIVGTIVAFNGPANDSAAGLAGGCIRAGLLFGAIWLAWPQMASLFTKAPRWLVGWFLNAKPDQKEAEKGAPPVPVKRPRRRSQQP